MKTVLKRFVKNSYNKLNPYGYCIQEETTNLTRLVFVEILKNQF